MVAVMTVMISVIEKMCTTVTLLRLQSWERQTIDFRPTPGLPLHAVLLKAPCPQAGTTSRVEAEEGIQEQEMSQGRTRELNDFLQSERPEDTGRKGLFQIPLYK